MSRIYDVKCMFVSFCICYVSVFFMSVKDILLYLWNFNIKLLFIKQSTLFLHRYECVCEPGWTGGDCDINIDDCASNPCENNGLCVDEVNGYSCVCETGYTGKNCQHTVDYCQVRIVFISKQPMVHSSKLYVIWNVLKLLRNLICPFLIYFLMI